VRGRDDYAVGQMLFSIAVVNQDCPRNDWCWCDTVVLLDDGFHPVAREHFQRGALGRRGQSVCILAHVERTVGALTPPIVADGLGDRQNVCLGEGTAQRRAAMSTCTKAYGLVRVCRVGPALVILALQLRQIDEHFLGSRLASEWRYCHVSYSFDDVRSKAAQSRATGHGSTFQMSAEYSAIVRSLENFPEPATFKIAFRAQACGSAYNSRTL